MTPGSSPPGQIPAEAFSLAKQLIIERTGHFYFADKDEALLERIRRRMRACGTPTLGDYVALLHGPGAVAEEWEALEAEVTIGETFFFRFADQFAALRDEILPSILDANAQTRRIRVWSAGCSNGAEAYSIGILLHDLLGSALPDWRVTVIGTDISAQAVASARAAVFNAWALRGMTPEDRDRYFVAGEPGRWILRPHYRALARFQQHNLLALLEAPPPVQLTDFDLVLCRNVLIYFHPETAGRLATALTACLGPKGWILFGHAEASLVSAARPGAVHSAATMVYRSSDAPAAGRAVPAEPAARPVAPAPVPAAPLAPAWAPLLPAPAEARPAQQRPAPAPVAPPAPPPGPSEAVEEVRRLADRGDIGAAVAACRRLLAADPMSPRLHFYEGMLLHAQGSREDALTALRRAVYLRKDHALAHYYQGLVLAELGQGEAGRRAIAVAARLAAQAPARTLVEDGDGMTAGDLGNLARHYLDSVAAVTP